MKRHLPIALLQKICDISNPAGEQCTENREYQEQRHTPGLIVGACHGTFADDGASIAATIVPDDQVV